MTNIEIEKRIAVLEAEVALLKSKSQKNGDKNRGMKKSRENLPMIRFMTKR